MAGRKRGPSLRTQWLGKILKDYRLAAGMKMSAAGEYIQKDQSALSRMEAGHVPMRVPEVLALLNLYNVHDGTVREELEALAREAFRQGWWEGYSADVDQSFVDYPWLEERSNAIRSFDAMVPAGLLQTQGYANAVIRAAEPDATEAQIRRWTDLRMERQKVLDTDNAPELSVVIDEAVLRRVAGNPGVMRDQLAHLVKMAARPTIDIRVLPFTAGALASPYGPFKVFEMPQPFADVAYCETHAGAMYVESEQVTRFALAYDQLRRAALTPERSIKLIEAAANDLN